MFQTHLRGGLIETGGRLMREGGLFNLSKTMLSVLPKELEYKVRKLTIKYKKLEVTQRMINNKSELSVGK